MKSLQPIIKGVFISDMPELQVREGRASYITSKKRCIKDEDECNAILCVGSLIKNAKYSDTGFAALSKRDQLQKYLGATQDLACGTTCEQWQNQVYVSKLMMDLTNRERSSYLANPSERKQLLPSANVCSSLSR